MNMDFERKLAIPMEVKEMYPLTEDIRRVFEERDREIKRIFDGTDDRLLLIIGPCSADNETSVLDYFTRLRGLADTVREKIYIVPRLYTSKPRTTGEGYKGFLHQPDPNEKPDLFKGIIATREIHMRAIKETGFTCADELLYPENYKYVDDLLGYVAIGARSVEDQQHRLTASGIEVPVGMKNPTSGDLTVMMNAITAASVGHSFIYRGWAAHSKGNPYAHAVLRGFNDMRGLASPNYHFEDVMRLKALYDKTELPHPGVVIDTNHCNSGKNPLLQGRIIKEVLSFCKDSDDAKKLVKGFMVESYIEDGNQKIGGGVYGKSITDACLGWKKTEKLVKEIAEIM